MSIFRSLLMQQDTGWKNMPADWSDIRKDCPANSIALYAAHSQTPQATYTKVGNPTITDSIVSGFTSSDYVKIDNLDLSQANTWEICIKIIKNGSGERYYPLGCNKERGITIATGGIGNAAARLYISSNGSNWDIIGEPTSITLPDNCYARVRYTGSEYIYDYSIDKQSWTVINTVQTSTKITNTSYITLGRWWGTYVLEGGSIDLKETYIKVDNELWLYDNLGFTATCIGGYKVFIDGVQYGTTYASGAKCEITWSTSDITTGDIIITPELLKAHKIWIEPATEGNNITAFHHSKVSTGSSSEEQGTLWIHFNLTNDINLNEMCSPYPYNYQVNLLESVTAKNDKLTLTGNTNGSFRADSLEYVPTIYNLQSGSVTFYGTKLEKIILKNPTLGNIGAYFVGASSRLKNLKITNPSFSNDGYYNYFAVSTMLKKFPDIDWAKVIHGYEMWSDYDRINNNGEPIVIDARAGTQIKTLGLFNTNSLIGLRVSNQAPFDETAPQINISYTNMDRQALVQLFNDLPYNVGYEEVGSPTINNGIVSGFSNDNYLTINSADLFTADNWEIVMKIPTNTTNNALSYPLAGNLRNTITFSTISSRLFLSSNGTSWDIANGIGTSINLPNNCYIRVAFSGTQYTYDYSLNKESWTRIATVDSSTKINSSAASLILGKWINNYYFDGSIDLNNTYIKVNDVYWFRGQPAMTKTLSCVGATGTTDLTAEDKDIALNKGWSLTLS